jgi:DNA-binding LacI/PurR family transcriptional regulator
VLILLKAMSSLREIVEASNVPALLAYEILMGRHTEDTPDRRAVLEAAQRLNYRLNITIHDVAYVAGVSIATVSYAINNTATISSETRARVLQTATSLDYIPSTIGRSLQAKENRLIGYAWHALGLEHNNPVLERFTYAMAHSAEALGYHVLTFAQPKDNLTRPFNELIRSNRVDGFIVADTNRDDIRVRHLMRAKVPFAAFGRANDNWKFPYVDVNGQQGVAQAVKHLVDQGHQKIAVLAWPDGSLSGDARLAGYHQALKAAKITPSPGWVIRSSNQADDARQAARNMLEALRGPNMPTALVCISDTLALGAMGALRELGMHAGQDIAVTGFDDDPPSRHLNPPLTSVRQPLLESATLLLDMLVRQIKGERSTDIGGVILSPTLVVRESSLVRV